MIIDDDDIENANDVAVEEYRAWIQQIKVEDILKLTHLDKLFSPADCHLMMSDECDRKYEGMQD